MNSYMPYIVIGITTGSVYGIAALGLVLAYKTSGLLNFGHGAIAAAAAMVFYELHIRHGVPWGLAALVAIAPFGLIAGLFMERLAAGLAKVPVAYRIVATVGLILAVPAVGGLFFGDSAQVFPPFLPRTVVFRAYDVRIGLDSVLIASIALIAAASLYFFFLRSRLGISMRAVVDRPSLLDLTGESPAKVRRIAWVIGCTFAAVSGVLLANTLEQLNVLLIALLVVQAFGAATIGGFTSLPLAYLGGVIVGVVQALMSKEGATHPGLAGLDLNVPFLFLFVGLLVIPRQRLVELGERVRPRVALSNANSRSRSIGAGLVGLAAAIIVPFVVGSHLPIWSEAASQILLFLSLSLLVRTSGQISLCQVGFAAVGATTFAHMLANGLPWGLAVLVAGLVAVPIGALISIPAIRLPGVYLALATLGFGILLNQYFYTKSYMFGVSTALNTARPHFLGLQSDRGYYFLLLALGLAGVAVVWAIEKARLGRLLRAMADSPTALSTLGTNTSTTRVIVFCISSFFAGVSGALIAGLFNSISSSPFPYLQSLIVLAVIVICGSRTVPAAILGALLLTVPAGYINGQHVGDWEQLIFGVLAIGAALFQAGRIPLSGRYGSNLVERRHGPLKVRIADQRPAEPRQAGATEEALA